MRKVAVTGASGHIGANLVRALLGRGYEVVALVRQSRAALEGLDIETLNGELSDLQSLRKAFRGVDQVFHLAAYISLQPGNVDRLQSVNVEGTQNVLDACDAEGVGTLIHFSSIHALDQEPMDQPVTERSPLLGRHRHGADYDHSKAAADKLVRDWDSPSLSTRIIYPTAVFGPNDFNLSLFGQAILKMAEGGLPALVSGGFDWVDARDVAWGAIEAAEKGADKDRFILSGAYLSVSEVATIIAEMTGVAAPRMTIPVRLAKLFTPLMSVWASLRDEEPVYTADSLSALCANKIMSHAKAMEVLAYKPRQFRETMRDALQFYSENGQLRLNPGGDMRI